MDSFPERVIIELGRAREKFPRPLISACEAREVIREEFDEFCEASRLGPQESPIRNIVRGQYPTMYEKATSELVQLAAMTFRAAIDCYAFPNETAAPSPPEILKVPAISQETLLALSAGWHSDEMLKWINAFNPIVARVVAFTKNTRPNLEQVLLLTIRLCAHVVAHAEAGGKP